MTEPNNIILVGMPGVGKSTVGVLLAKACRRGFIDTDVLIQIQTGRSLQEIIDAEGLEAFCHLEEECVLELDVRRQVIATGGSVIYSEPAMTALAQTGPILHLDLPLEQIQRRLDNLATRGVVMMPGQSLAELYVQRMPLYRQWADITLDCSGKTQDRIVQDSLHALGLS